MKARYDTKAVEYTIKPAAFVVNIWREIYGFRGKVQFNSRNKMLLKND